ncbi:HAD family hydrolase [Peribacillus sp. SCS-37]|uniref:HAD family hydrolase n=1 Tax=Paraperibacillus esterisolvens TaxID=3115296 RepID=UPI003906C308
MDSIIFDLDGTLWDSLDSIITAWNKVLKEYNLDVKKEELQAVTGLQMKEIGERLFSSIEEEERTRILAECNAVECQWLGQRGGKLYDGLEDVLSYLSNKYKLFIVSNCQDGYIEAFYKFHGLERFFADYENPGRTGLPKGENIKLIMERNSLQEAIYVGDTESDRKAAETAGIPFVYADYGFGAPLSYDYKISSLQELKELF